MLRRDLVIAGLMTLPLTARRGFAAPPPVVLELFTSQGCSSCPPADALLGELARQPGVIALAWHVDYWNGLGWRDRFSRPEWTERQKAYARNLNEEVYTPALVVNGAAMVVGSDKAAVRRAMEAAVPPAAVTLRRAGAGLEAEINLAGTPASVLLVTYDPEQTTRIDAGENQDRNLVEYRVVRDAITLNGPGPRFALPQVANDHGAVLLVRDSAGRIIGAADLPPAAAG